jgi:hydroxymethylpyrimidine pyrophosphatase-like HAD family hydrolase
LKIKKYPRKSEPVLKLINYIKFDAMAFHNGAVIFCGGELAANYGIEPGTAQALARKLAQSGMKIGLEIDDVNYANYDAAAGWPGMEYVHTDFGFLPETVVDKIIIKAPSAADIALARAILPENLYLEINEGVLGLIMHREATKLRAAEFFAEHFGISLRDIAAFGDDLNDAALLRECGVGVAVENALEEVKLCADCIVKPLEKQFVFAVYFSHCCVVVLAGLRHGCVLLLALRKIFSQIRTAFQVV